MTRRGWWSWVLAVAVPVLAVCGGGSSKEARGYIIRFDPADCRQTVGITVGPATSGAASSLTFPSHTGSFAFATSMLGGSMDVAFMTPGSQGSLAEPAPGWMVLRLTAATKTGDVLMLGTSGEFGLWYHDEATGEEHTFTDGTLTVDSYSLVPDPDTSGTTGEMDGGTFSLRLTVAGALIDLGDGVKRPASGSLTASGTHAGTRPPPSGGTSSSGGGGSVVRFTCRESNVCVEYSIADRDRAQSTRARCASSNDGHTCNRSGAKTCRHVNATNGDVLCAVTSSAPSNHDQRCRDTGGQLGC